MVSERGLVAVVLDLVEANRQGGNAFGDDADALPECGQAQCGAGVDGNIGLGDTTAKPLGEPRVRIRKAAALLASFDAQVISKYPQMP